MAGLTKRINIFVNDNKAGATIGELYKDTRKLKNEINQLTPGTEAYKRKVQELKGVNGQLDTHRNKIKGIGGAFSSIKAGVGQLKSLFLGPLGIIGLVMGAVSVFKNWVSANKEVEKSLSSLRSLTGASTEDLKVYKKEAIEMGRSTTLSATQVVDGFKLVGSARPELLKNRDALIAVTKEAITLAEASEMELGGSTQAMVGIMNQFGLANEDAGRTINALAAGSKEGAADIESLSKATDKSGTVAAGYNVTLEENIALLETMAEKNIKSEEAGTKLRNVLLTMQTIEALPAEAVEQAEKYGVNLQLVSDKTVPFNERLREMAKVGGDAVAMTKIFGKENVVAAGIILNNTDKVEAYTKAVTGTNTAYEQAAINTDNLDGDLKSLSSAWEGLNLIIDGSNAILRPFIQGVTSLINWVSDLISAYRDLDSLKIENVWLRLKTAVFGVNTALGEHYREQLRMNELSSGIIDQISDMARETDIYTTAIAQNNDLLKNANLTEEEATRLHEENEKMIAILNEAYPELTSEIDFQTASYGELSILQKEITKNMTAQAIETAKVAEQERILNTIVQNSIAISKTRAQIKSGDDLGLSAMIDYADAIKNVEIEKENLKGLDDTFKDVTKTIEDMNLNFGADFDANTNLVIEANRQLTKFNEQLANATNDEDKAIIQAQIDAGKKLLLESGKVRQEQIDALLNGEKVEATKEELELIADEKKKADEKAAAAAKRELARIEKDLQTVIENVQKFQEEAANKARVSGQTTDEGKELVELEISLEKKYNKQIEAAEKLAAGTGQVAEQAQEQLKHLEALKTAETEELKAEIRTRYEQERIDAAIKQNLHLVDLEQNAQKALLDLKVKQAAANLVDVEGLSLQAQKEANDKYNQALMAQLAYEKSLKVDALIQQYADDEITIEELNARKEELEMDHQGNLNKIQKEASEERMNRIAAEIGEVLGVMDKGMQIMNTFREAGLQNSLNENDEWLAQQNAKLEKDKAKGLITEEEFLNKKRGLEAQHQNEIAAIKTEAAENDKKAAIIQAAIDGASAAVKAIALYGPPPSPAGIAGLVFAAASTIANIALIKAQPIPQFAGGGYHDVVGATDGRNYNAKYLGAHKGGMLPGSPSLVLASEKGPEYFVPNHLLSNPNVANYVGMIEAIRTNQMASGGFSQRAQQGSTAENSSALIMEVIMRNTAVLEMLAHILPNIKAELNINQVDEITKAQQSLAEIRA